MSFSTRGRYALAIVVLLAGATIARAQAPALVACYEFGVPLGIDRTPSVINRFYDGDGTSYNHAAFLGVDLPIALDAIADRFAVRLGASYSGGRFTSSRYLTDRARDRTTLTPIAGALASFTVTSREALAHAAVDALFDVGDAWSARAGLWMTGRLWGRFEQVEWLIAPSAAVFTNDSAVQLLASGDAIAAPAIRAGVELGVTRAMRIGGLELRPELGLRFDQRGISEGIGLRALTGIAGVAVGLGEIETPGSDRDPLVERPPDSTTIPAVREEAVVSSEPNDRSQGLGELGSAPSVSVRLRAADGERAVVLRARVVERRLYLPFGGVLLLDGDSLSGFYLTSTADTGAAHLSSLGPTELARHRLVVLAERMRARPDATLRLVAPFRDAAERPLALRRANAVRGTIATRLGIDIARIRTDVERREGRSDFVRIESATAALTAPIVTAVRERELEAPAIGIEQSIEPASQAMRWQLEVRRGARVLLTRDDRSRSATAAISFPLRAEEATTSLEPLVATLLVEDLRGVVTVARDTLAVVADTVITAAPSMIASALLLPSVDGLPDPALENERVVRRIVELIDTSSTVVLTSSAQETGAASALVERLIAARRLPHRLRIEPSESPLPTIAPGIAAGAIIETR